MVSHFKSLSFEVGDKVTYILLMSAAAALRETATIYGAVPEQLPSGRMGNPLESTKALVAQADDQQRTQKVRSIALRGELDRAVTALIATGVRSGIDEALENLEQAIADISEQAEKHAAYVAFVQVDSEKLLETIRTNFPGMHKGARKQIAKFIDIGKEIHADIVDMYYFLLAIRSQLDPEAKGGPSFHDPEKLRAYLEAATAD